LIWGDPRFLASYQLDAALVCKKAGHIFASDAAVLCNEFVVLYVISSQSVVFKNASIFVFCISYLKASTLRGVLKRENTDPFYPRKTQIALVSLLTFNCF
jgi:hypothetical protein